MAKTRNSRSTKSKKSSPSVETVVSTTVPSSLEVLAKPAPGAETAVAQTPSEAVKPVTSHPAAPSHADIARRAYELFLGRGGACGNPMQDWLDAERELGSRAA